jgi:hypothetical protein
MWNSFFSRLPSQGHYDHCRQQDVRWLFGHSNMLQISPLPFQARQVPPRTEGTPVGGLRYVLFY